MRRKPSARKKTRRSPVKVSRASKSRTAVATIAAAPKESDFREVVALIERARERAFHAVNTELIDLYWRVGEFISRKLETAVWGQGVITELAAYIQQHHPNLRGFTRASLFRMRQFFDTYRHDKKVAALLRQLPWSSHCATKDTEVVEYALARSVSPALIAEYKTQLPDAALLRRKLHEFYALAQPAAQAQPVRRLVLTQA